MASTQEIMDILAGGETRDPDRSRKLYELSALPQFSALIELLQDFGLRYFANLPKDINGVPAFMSFAYVQWMSSALLTELRNEIEVGRRLSTEIEGKPDAEKDGYHGERSRA